MAQQLPESVRATIFSRRIKVLRIIHVEAAGRGPGLKGVRGVARALFPGRRVLWMPLNVDWSPPTKGARHCCASMVDALHFECEQHADPFACADALVVYNEIMDEYGLIIHDGTASYVLIDCCPWCGTRLPQSARDTWFDKVDALDLAEGVSPPKRFLTSAWRRP
jgi:Domain of unknown function (DUF6980)